MEIPRISRLAFLLALSLLALENQAQNSFLAPAEEQGRIELKLHPTEVVSAGTPVLVTFGMPFPKASITEAELSTVRLMDGEQEIPAHVSMLNPWRPDNNSVRIARVQFEYTFSQAYPAFESIELEWGNQQRSQEKVSFEDPRSAWHLVTAGSFEAADAVYEPDVYVVLPKEHLSKGVLKLTRMSPFHKDIGIDRDDPASLNYAAMDSGRIHESAGKNFFYTLVNEDTDPNTLSSDQICDYKNQSEPWLFDRSAAMYVNYFRSGSFKILREAVRASQYYASKIYPEDYNNCTACTGMFSLKMTDPIQIYPGGNSAMYSYTENLAYTYWLTGDEEWLPTMHHIVKAYEQSEATRWAPEVSVWTERHTGLELLATMVAYEVFGTPAYWYRSMDIIGDFIWHQNGAGGQIAASTLDGGLYHYGHQHAWDWDENSLGMSPWMSSLIVDPMLRAYAHTEADSIAEFVVKLGHALASSCIATDIFASEYANADALQCPLYAMGPDGNRAAGSEYDEYAFVEHALDVGIAIAWAYYFDQMTGNNTPFLREKAEELYKTYAITVQYWTRPTGPDYQKTQYRIAPWRKYAWQQRNTGSYPWLLYSNEYPAHIQGELVEKGNLKLFPNPAQDYVMLTLPEIGEEAMVRIIDNAGRIHFEKSYYGAHTIRMPLKNIRTGIYFMQVETNGESLVKRFLKVE